MAKKSQKTKKKKAKLEAKRRAKEIRMKKGKANG